MHSSFTEPLLLNTRTELWGRGKKGIGGWLEEYNKANVVPLFKEDLEVKDIQVAEPVGNCLHSVSLYIIKICNLLDVHDYRVYVERGLNFRHNIILPQGRRYKQNREGTVRALLTPQVEQYLIYKHDAEIVEGIEVDDKLSMIGYEGHKKFLVSGDTSSDTDIIISRDKDTAGTQGWWMNPDHRDKPPIYLSGFGKLWLDKGKVRGVGRKFKYFQILFGDSSDGYAGKVTPNKTFVFGEKSIIKLLQPLTTDKECWELIVTKYREWMPVPVSYIAWDDSKVEDNWLTWLQKHFTLVHMLRFEGDNPQVMDILTKLKIHIGV